MTEQSLEERKQAVIEQITKAFDGVSRGDGITLHQAWAIEHCENEEEEMKARKSDTETRWQDVNEENFHRWGVCLIFFDAEGYRYYLPAFMIWSLRNLEGEYRQYGTHSCIVFTFGNYSQENRHFIPCEHRDEFNLTQKRAIAAFLLFKKIWYRSYYGSDNADEEKHCLDNYWGQFLEGD